MYVQPVYSNNINMTGTPRKPSGWSKFTDRIKKSIFDAIPEATIKSKNIDTWKAVDEVLSRPAENRVIMGTTALLTQPWIDIANKDVDEKTRKISKNRTIAKIIAGTSVGILVRGLSYKLVGNFTDINGTGKFSQALLPKKFIDEIKNNPKFLNNYKSALSTGIAILAMCITNFLLDAPLTVYLTNKMNKGLVSEQKNNTSPQKKCRMEVKHG